MSYRIFEYRCERCGGVTEDMIDGEPSESGECGAIITSTIEPYVCKGVTKRIMSAPGLALVRRGNTDFLDRERARLARRSHDHAMLPTQVEERRYKNLKALGLEK